MLTQSCKGVSDWDRKSDALKQFTDLWEKESFLNSSKKWNCILDLLEIPNYRNTVMRKKASYYIGFLAIFFLVTKTMLVRSSNSTEGPTWDVKIFHNTSLYPNEYSDYFPHIYYIFFFFKNGTILNILFCIYLYNVHGRSVCVHMY